MLKIRSKFCRNFGRTSQGDVVGRVSAHYVATEKIQREIRNPQMFETDPALSPFPQQSTLTTT
jgi:hypothetical protein